MRSADGGILFSSAKVGQRALETGREERSRRAEREGTAGEHAQSSVLNCVIACRGAMSPYHDAAAHDKLSSITYHAMVRSRHPRELRDLAATT